MFFCVSIYDHVTKILKIGTQDAFTNCYNESKFQLSRFNRLLVISKSILICQNSRTKPMVPKPNFGIKKKKTIYIFAQLERKLTRTWKVKKETRLEKNWLNLDCVVFTMTRIA